MIHYHGSPITPNAAAAKVLQGKHSFVSFSCVDQLDIARDVCQSFALDNGAFSAWMAGNPVKDWSKYYSWVEQNKRYPGFDFAVIPDVIDGNEQDNDSLINEWPHAKHQSAVVWHMHESIDRLVKLANEWPLVAIGSSGEFAIVGNTKWWQRINTALNAICVDGQPICKLHGLRMLNPEVFTKIPFSSADSTSVGRNVGIDSAWKGTFQPPDKEWRALILAARIEAFNSANFWQQQPEQDELCLF